MTKQHGFVFLALVAAAGLGYWGGHAAATLNRAAHEWAGAFFPGILLMVSIGAVLKYLDSFRAIPEVEDYDDEFDLGGIHEIR